MRQSTYLGVSASGGEKEGVVVAMLTTRRYSEYLGVSAPAMQAH
jgi:hypothetical protein